MNEQECIPVGYVPSAHSPYPRGAVSAQGGCLSGGVYPGGVCPGGCDHVTCDACWDTPPHCGQNDRHV